MAESQRLWEKYGSEINDPFLGSPYADYDPKREFSLKNIKELLSDYSPWITDREPTREDGGKCGYILRMNTAGVPYLVEWDNSSPEGKWMRIPK